MSDTFREAFEKWVNNPHMLHRCDEPGHTDDYTHPWTVGAWSAWQAAQPQWRPIKTAPRDGTAFLASNGHGIYIAHYWCDAFRMVGVSGVKLDIRIWMPLPEPPNGGAKCDTCKI